jgi:hypothetical protein
MSKSSVSKNLTIFDRLFNDSFCVRRCGFYKNRYTIHTLKSMLNSGEYYDKTGCNGEPWLAFEGSYSECKNFVKNNNN